MKNIHYFIRKYCFSAAVCNTGRNTGFYIRSMVRIPALVVVILAGLTSCLKENLDDCVDPRGNVRLTLSLDETAKSDPLGNYKIDNAYAFVFDATTDQYVTHVVGGEYVPGTDYEFFLTLPTGDYNFIVWTNIGTFYKTNHTVNELEAQRFDVDEMEFFLETGTGSLTSEIPDLLYGLKRSTVTGNRDNHITVVIIPSTYMINIKVQGLPSTANNYEFSITDNNSHYEFIDNTIISGHNTYQHIRSGLWNAGDLNASIKVLRLMEGRSTEPVLTFRNPTSGETLFNQSLISTIVNAYRNSGQTVDFGRVFTFNIVLSYNTNMDVAVSVNGWDYKTDGNNL